VKFLPLIWSSLRRKIARTVFTMLSVTTAFMLFGLLQGVNTWLGNFGAKSNASRLYVASRVSHMQPLPSAYLSQIERVAGIRKATLVGAISGIYQEKGNDVVALATDPAAIFDLYPEWRVEPAQLQALTRTRDGAVVGEPLMRAHGWKLGDRVPLRTSLLKTDGSTDWNFEIVGIYDVPSAPAQANRMLVNYAFLDGARLAERGTAYAFVVAIENPTQSAQISAAIDTLFANSPDETVTQDEKTYVQGQLRQIGDVGLMANAVVGAVLFTLLFLTSNTMMQSVRERTPELAILKSLGFSDNLVTGLVLSESLLLCILAAALGLAVAALIFPAAAALGVGGASLPLNVVAAGFATAVLLALASGLPPARRARRLAIVDALIDR
jgi:putative ABC transport system permease protein